MPNRRSGRIAAEATRDFAARGELTRPLPVSEAAEALARLDGYHKTERDRSEEQWQFTQLKGQFFTDRDGVIRWVNIECAREGLAGLGKFPTAEELVAAAQTTMGQFA